jgi:cytochrome c oxidase accessory protein FixG
METPESKMTPNVDRVMAAPPERTSVIDETGRRRWMYPERVRGRFARWRDIIFSVLILFYVAAPWIEIAGIPLLRFDLPGRRFHIFGAQFVATDAYLLALFLLISMLALFLFSALLGRLWCGWACPQTVYLDGVFRRVEWWIEGPPSKRKALDRGPRDDVYYTKKGIKHAIFIALSLFLSFSFTAYFVGPRASFAMLGGSGEHPTALIIGLVTTACLYFDFAFFREQFCTFLCPYARLQTVMLDKHSLVIGYDPKRGEPRGPIRPETVQLKVLGDCIDCKRCVQVCPTGIDIREGLQLECIACAACIDACDMVMDKVGRPRGLIRYDSTAGLQGTAHKILRPRSILYVIIMILVTTLLTVKLRARETVDFAVVRPPGTPYIVQDDGKVRNMFQINVTNVDPGPHAVKFQVDGPAGLEYLIPGEPFQLASGERIKVEAFVMLPDSLVKESSTQLKFQMLNDGQATGTRFAKFLGPVFAARQHEREEHDERGEESHEQH